MIVLDTNVVSEVLKPQPDAGVVAWLESLTDDVAITATTLAELTFDAATAPRYADILAEREGAGRPIATGDVQGDGPARRVSEGHRTVFAMNTPASSAQLTAWNDQQDRRVASIIRQHGCFTQAVSGEGEQPPFAYTVGLYGLGHPELIVFGLHHESAGGALNWFADRVRSGSDLTPGEIVAPPGSDTRFLVETFARPGEYLHAANRHYGRRRDASVQAYQLTWDVDGLFPWEAGYPYPGWLQPRSAD